MSDTSYNIYVSAGSFDSPFFEFYIDASGTQELTPANTLYLDTSYIFHRLDDNTSHPFYISDVSYEEPSTQNITLSGDGSYNDGIIGSETFTLEFTGLDVSGPLYYYCTNHSSMVNAFSLVLNTPDIVAPTITSISPTLNATDIFTNTTFNFFFNETVVDGSGGIIIYDASDNTIIQTIDGSDPQVSISDNQVSVSLSTDLSYNTSFYVNIDAGAFQDSAGNDFAGLDSSTPDTGMRFTTEIDSTIPFIIDILPLLDAIDVSANTNLEFTFSEDVVESSGNILIYDASDNTLLQTIDVSSSDVTISGSQVTVDPPIDLSYSTSFYVNIDTGAFQDLRGNPFAGLDSAIPETGIRFTTIEPEGDPDIIQPTITGISPVLNATDVQVNTQLRFAFSEQPILDVNGNIVIHRSSDNAVIQRIDVTGPNVNISGKQVVVTLPTYLPPNTSVYVNIGANALLDSAGNNFPGLNSSTPNTGMRFTTIDPATTRQFEIIRFCQDRKCQQTIDYNRLKTGGNDPTVSRAMRFSQYVRGNKASR